MSKQGSNNKIWLLVLVPVVLFVLGALFLPRSSFQVLSTGGQVAARERNLILVTTLLGLLVVVPVFIMTYTIAWRYRESNTHVAYEPDWDGDRVIEATWWFVPCVIIGTLAIIAWHASHALDPRQQITSAQPPLQVQVIALQWRWLFIYPKENIATLNYLEMPVNRPVEFSITSDAPMNSFWIPKLGGQIYAMPGMSTPMHLIANQAGTYRGSSANLSGKGFAGMTFEARAVSQQSFDEWTDNAQLSPNFLTTNEYLHLSQPNTEKTTRNYVLDSDNLYDRVIMKYMEPGAQLQPEVSYAR